MDWGDGTSEATVISSKTVTASHAYGDNGAYAVTVTVTDDDGGISAQGFTATIGNASPNLAALPDQTAAEGSLLSLQGATFTDTGFLDSHTGTVDWGDGTTEAATISSKTLFAQHIYGDDGAYPVTVSVTDDDGGTASRTFTATVTNVAPSLASLGDQNTAEGSLISLQGASFTDPGFLDTHTATVDWGDGTTESGTISSKTVQAQHAYGDNGTYAVTVTVADDDGGASSRSFTATVSNVSPSLTALGDQSAAEGAFVSLQGAQFTDPGILDSHTATVDWGDGTAGAAAISSKTISAQHAYGDNGAYTVTVTVTDDDGGTAARNFTATVGNVAPTLAALADRNAAEGSTVSLQGATFTDPGFLDTHSASVNWGDGTSEAAIVSSHTVNASHSYGDNGVYAVTVTVTDDEGGTSVQGFTATIGNVAPSLVTLASQNAAEGSLVSLQGAAFTDPGFLDSHTATVDWGDGTTQAASISSKTVQAQHSYGDNGAYTVTLTVADDDGGISIQAFTATVGNVAPSLAALADQAMDEGSPISLQGATFTDPGFLDSHTAIVDWGDGTTAPATISSNAAQAQHTYGDNGAYTVTVTVADDDAGTSARTFTATVNNVRPSLAALTDQSAAEGSPVILQGALFTDPGSLDSHSATVNWGDGTTEAAAVSSKTILAQHVYGDNGPHAVTVTVVDDDGGTVASTFTATISNVAPSLAALGDQAVVEGSLLSLQGATFTDPGFLDTHAATVDWGDGATEPAVISSKTVQGQHAFGDNGAYTVTVTVADDDGGISARSFTATVSNVSPSLAALADQNAAEGLPVSLQGATFTDSGILDTHTASVDWGDGTTEAAVVSSKAVLAQHAYGDNGAYTVLVTVTDDDGGTSARSFTATVSNAAPSLAALADQTAEEGSLVGLQGATFVDPGSLDTHTATVDWGDGTAEAAVVSSKAVLAQHAYGDNAAYTVTVTVDDDDGGTSAQSFTATVGNVAPSLAALADQSAAEGASVGIQGAAFTDPGFLDSHTATVDWGDGSSEAAAISSKSVQAQHAFGDNGAYTVTVTVSDDDGGTASRTFTATVGNVAPSLAALGDQNSLEGSVVSLQGAAFTDPGFLDTHTAAVDWGDGTSAVAAVSSKTVSAQHAYG
ncbi:MAG: PDK repeat-containing protein, partial [bacterium]